MQEAWLDLDGSLSFRGGRSSNELPLFVPIFNDMSVLTSFAFAHYQPPAASVVGLVIGTSSYPLIVPS